jgi:hypothetical protein
MKRRDPRIRGGGVERPAGEHERLPHGHARNGRIDVHQRRRRRLTWLERDDGAAAVVHDVELSGRVHAEGANQPHFSACVDRGRVIAEI